MIKTAEREELGRKIVSGLYREGMILTWFRDKPEGWRLASGLWSPFYVNLRLISSGEAGLYRLAGRAMAMLAEGAGFAADGKHRLIGIAMAGIPLANAMTLETGIPSSYTRKLPEEAKTPADVELYLKSHGQKSLIEGILRPGDRLALVDDLVTGFESKLLAASQVRQEVASRGLADVKLEDVMVLLDREQGAAERAKSEGFRLHAFIPFAYEGVQWLRDSLDPFEYETLANYLANPQRYQDKDMQERLAAMARK